MPRSRLRNVKISSIHLVDRGDNPDARFVMLKSAPEELATDDVIDEVIEREEALNQPKNQAEAYAAVRKIAADNDLTYSEALRSAVGQRIYKSAQAAEYALAEEPTDVFAEDTPPDEDVPPDYLRVAAERIALRDNISVERAYARLSREEPELAKRYRETT